MAPAVTYDGPRKQTGQRDGDATLATNATSTAVNTRSYAVSSPRNGDNTLLESSPVPLWVNGQETPTSTTYEVRAPSSGRLLWTSSTASPTEAVRAVEAAQAAFPGWRATKPSAMQAIFLKAADIAERRRDELAIYMMNETGALTDFTDFNLSTMIDLLRDVAGRPANIHGAIPRSAVPGRAALVLKEPYGVNLGIAPWNAPYILGLRAVLYPLAAGNTVVLKGSERCPRTFWAIGSVLREAGLPEGALNIIYTQQTDAAPVIDALIEHEAVRKINFTGSTAIGSIISGKAGRALKPVVMELGGKANAIVCADADIDHAAFQCALGAFLHAGQICMATERILVHRDVLQPFSAALKAACDKLFAATADAPLLIDDQGVRKNQALVSDALRKGASILHGPFPPPDTTTTPTSPPRMRPTILTSITPAMDIYHTESFGPTVSMLPFTSDADALAITNDTIYGLSSAVFSRDLAHALRLARHIDAGAVHINSMTVHDEAGLPHGGTKASGWGRFNAQWGVEEFLRLKTVTFNED